MADAKKDKLQTRNSTVDFLVFPTKMPHEDGIEVRVQDHDVWLTQGSPFFALMYERSVVTKHLKMYMKAVNCPKMQLVQICTSW